MNKVSQTLGHEGQKIEWISKPRNSDFPADWYDLADEEHFWMHWRFRAITNLLDQLNVDRSRPHQVLDIGCGNGILRKRLESTTSWTVDCADLDLQALARTAEGKGRTLYYDITEKKMKECYDFIFLLDVIEHIADVAGFLESAFFHLKPGGLLVVNVPALSSLFSQYDTAAGHIRRYNRGTLTEEFRHTPGEIIKMGYWGFTLLPLAALRKLVIRKSFDTAKTISLGFTPPSPFVNSLFRSMGNFETQLWKSPPLGTSLLTAVRKSADKNTSK